MKQRSDRLKRVQDLAATEERDYCRAMGDAQRELDRHLDRLKELETYRREYAASRAPGGKGAIPSVRYTDYRNFLKRLDDAVRAQSEVVQSSRLARDAHRERWMVKRRKSESLQRVVDRAVADESRHRELMLQKQQDDAPPAPRPFGGRQR